jgi:hypothetical protein
LAKRIIECARAGERDQKILVSDSVSHLAASS